MSHWCVCSPCVYNLCTAIFRLQMNRDLELHSGRDFEGLITCPEWKMLSSRCKKGGKKKKRRSPPEFMFSWQHILRRKAAPKQCEIPGAAIVKGSALDHQPIKRMHGDITPTDPMLPIGCFCCFPSNLSAGVTDPWVSHRSSL